MGNWLIDDYEKRCYNLLVKLGLVNLEGRAYIAKKFIQAETKKIMKEQKCDQLAALKRYSNQLFNELIEYKKNGREKNVGGGNND